MSGINTQRGRSGGNYPTVASLVADINSVSIGDIIEVYENKTKYYISLTNEGSGILLDNELYANPGTSSSTPGVVYPSDFGAVADFSNGSGTDNLSAMQACIADGRKIVFDGDYGWTGELAINKDTDIDFNGFTFGPIGGSLTDACISYNGPNIGYDQATATTISLRNGVADGSGREYILYLSDPVTGDPILDPAVNKTRNPNFMQRGSLIKITRAANWVVDNMHLINNQTIGIIDNGSKNHTISNIRVTSCGKPDDPSAPITTISFGSLYKIDSISSANPAVIRFEADYGIPDGATIRLVRCNVAGEDTPITLTKINNIDYELNGVDSTGITFVRSAQSIACSESTVHSEGGTIHGIDSFDTKFGVLQLQPTKGALAYDINIKNNGETAIFVADSYGVTVEDFVVDGCYIADITANAVECGRSYGLKLRGRALRTDSAALDLQGSERFDVDVSTANIITTPTPLYNYGPTSEDWNGTTQGPLDKAGDPKPDATLSHIKVASLNNYDCENGIIKPNADDTGIPSFAKTIIAISSNDNSTNQVKNIRIANGSLSPLMQESDYANGKVSVTNVTPDWSSIYIANNAGHASESDKQVSEVITSGDTGAKTVDFGFPPSKVAIQASVNGFASLVACDAAFTRDSLFSLSQSAGAAGNISLTNTGAVRLRDPSGTIVFEAGSFSLTGTGLSYNVNTSTTDATITFCATP